MKIALIGYGRMGREIEGVLRERGHEVVLVVGEDSQERFTRENLRKADAAIEFTTPATAFGNVSRCLEWGVPVVCGTTGWNDTLPEAYELCRRTGGTFFYASNFSIGVNILFSLNEELARIMNRFPQYGASIREIHHIHKKDSPSGTAVTLAEGVLANLDRKMSWVNHQTDDPHALGIESVREGEVFGLHEVRYDSPSDSIALVHDTKSRRGLAEGAVLAAEFTRENKGVLTMKDLLGL